MQKRRFEANRDIIKCPHCDKWISVVCPIGQLSCYVRFVIKICLIWRIKIDFEH